MFGSLNKNVDIQFSAYNTFLEKHESGTLLDKRTNNQIIEMPFAANKPKGLKRIKQSNSQCEIA